MSLPPLRDYQVDDLAFLMAHPRGLLLHDPGGGKTPTVCVLMAWRWREAREKALWVMPKSLFRKNRDELLRFTDLTPDQIQIVESNQLDPNAVVYLLTADRLRDRGKDFLDAEPSIQTLVADELHMYWSTSDSKRTQAWYRHMRRIPRFVGMTGTLIKGRLDSAYPVIHVIEPRYYPSHKAFMSYHTITDDEGNIVAWRETNRLAEIISRHAIRRSFADIYGPEAKVIVTEQVDMSPKQREAYSEFEAKAILELEDEFLTGATGGVFAIRCRQIMAHPETFGLAQGERTGKDEILLVHLSNHQRAGTQLVIYAALQPEQERIRNLVAAQGMTVGLINGNTSAKRRADIDEDFRAGRIQCIVGSPQVAAVGFNWENASQVIFASLDYQADTFTQAYRRAIRGQRSTPLLITVLEYADSIDQRIFSIVRRKSELENKVDANREVLAL